MLFSFLVFGDGTADLWKRCDRKQRVQRICAHNFDQIYTFVFPAPYSAYVFGYLILKKYGAGASRNLSEKDQCKGGYG